MYSLFILFTIGLILGEMFQRMKLPRIIGFIVSGMLIGPFGLNLLDDKMLYISPDLRQLALILLVLRAGLSLDIKDLKEIGRPAFFLSFLPAVFEITATTLIAPLIFQLNYLESFLIGTVLAAVSPAVIVPRMLYLMENRFGTKKKIPQMLLTGASMDDVFTIILFTLVIGFVGKGSFNAISILYLPLSILAAICIGVLTGFILYNVFEEVPSREMTKLLILFTLSFLLVGIEEMLRGTAPFSGLLAIMAMSMVLHSRKRQLSSRLAMNLSNLWVVGELILFVLVGTTVDLSYLKLKGGKATLLVLLVLGIRLLGVFVSLIKTELNRKEKVFSMISYIPKSTVQAAIGSLPLAMGLDSGQTIVTVAVASILITAPLGSFLIDHSYSKLLTRDEKNNEKSLDNPF